MSKNLCKICKKNVIGRQGKLFCSSSCKNIYHKGLRKFVSQKTEDIDKILHRNRAILQEIIGKDPKDITDLELIDVINKFDYFLINIITNFPAQIARHSSTRSISSSWLF